jgi:hypothetical protein
MSVRKRRIIYVVGLGHSGSTVLDMLLTTGGKTVGLGQVWTVLREEPAQSRVRVCSCGAAASDCPVWGTILLRLAELSPDASARDKYQIVLDSVDQLYGPDMALVDSSKHAEYLKTLIAMPASETTVLHNIKDVRAFTISTLDNNRRKQGRSELPEKIFYQWYRDNRASLALAGRLLGRAPIRVNYEGLCLSLGSTVARLAEALGEDYIDPGASLDQGHTHIISGNRLRLAERGEPKRLGYDYRWFTRHEWLRPYVLLPMIRQYNEQCLRELGDIA